MRLNKKALSAAITLSLVLGAYGVAGATENLYGAISGQGSTITGVTPDKAATTDSSKATKTGANYEVTSGTWNYVNGGYSGGSDAVSSNVVTISGGTIYWGVYGGYSSSGNTEGNTVKISGASTEITGYVYGGDSYWGNAEGNTVTIEGGEIKTYESGGKTYGGKVYGGWAYGDATGNTVTISQTDGITTEITDRVYGGYSSSGTASSNEVTIKGGSVGSFVFGGSSYEGDAKNNTVTMEGGTITGAVYGGNSSRGAASSNTVTVSGGSVGGTVYGAAASTGASSNTVTIKGGTISNVLGGFSDSGVVSGNTVNISSGSISGEVIGGYCLDGAVNHNTVTIEGGTVGNVYGGRSVAASGKTISGTVSYNTVMITGGSITGNVYGGAAEAEEGGTNNGTAEYNTVTIANATVDKGVWGGASDKGDAQYNTINLSKANITGMLCGGDPGKNNTLNVFSVGNSVGSIVEDNNKNSFQNMNFFIPASAKSGAMLTVGSGVYYDKTKTPATWTATDLAMSGVTNIGLVAQNGANLTKGDTITLINVTATDKVIVYDNTDGTSANNSSAKLKNSGDSVVTVIPEGDFVAYDATVTAESKAITAQINSKKLTDASKSPVETQVAGMAMLGMGGDVLAGAGMESAGVAAKAAKADNLGAANVMAPFAVIGGNNTRVNSGSHVDLKSWNMNVGFSKEVKNASSKLLFGPVVEYGNGSYDSYLDNGYHGDGRTNFVGVGFIAKQTNNDDTYYEGSLRAGRLANEYKSNGGSYDESTMYYGLHAGLGKVYQLNAANNIDLFLKAFWVHQNSMDTTLASRDLDMEAVDSFRSKLGFRYNHSFNAKNAMYAGLAWQYEFCGEAEATYDHMAVANNPSLKGHTGILELGWKNNAAKNLELDLGINAYTGVQRGAGANIKLNWKF